MSATTLLVSDYGSGNGVAVAAQNDRSKAKRKRGLEVAEMSAFSMGDDDCDSDCPSIVTAMPEVELDTATGNRDAEYERRGVKQIKLNPNTNHDVRDDENSRNDYNENDGRNVTPEPKFYEPTFGTPPHPSTCDPDMDLDSFVKTLVQAYLGYTPQTLSVLSLPESYFPGINEEHMACYGVEVVAAVRENNLQAIKALHAAGHPLACCNRFGESLMHMACRRGYVQVFQFLLNDASVDVRIRDDCGRSPLHDACWNRDPQYEIVDALLRKDPALLLIADKRGHTPFAYARREHWGLWRQFLSDRAQYILQGLDRIEERNVFGGDK